MAEVRFQVLGPLEVRVGSAPVPVPVGRQRRLLAALLLAKGSIVSADRLIDVIWRDEPPVNARNALQTAVTRLRHTLAAAGPVVIHQPPGYRLDLRATRFDADEFARLVERAAGADQPEWTVRLLDEALALWGGPAWGELAADVARGDALRLEELRLSARERRAAALLSAGRGGEAVGALEVILAEAPLREGAVAHLARAHRAAGRTADALAVLARHRRLLADELGLDPPPELARLQERILRQERDEPGVEDGPARGPVRGSFAAGRESGQPDPRPLPRRPGDLVGRASEVERLRRHLAAHPMTTVIGPGGVGKTRLVHHVVSATGEPVWWVDLAAVRDPSTVAQAVADVLQVESVLGTAAVDALPAVLGQRSGILVLDNCEHVVTAAAQLMADALSRPLSLRVVATSRERLGIEGERVMPLSTLTDAAAVELFLARAAESDPELEPDHATLRRITAMCRSLDGLPLAIELAAARVGTLTVDDLADRLDARFDLLTVAPRTGPAKHRTLRAVVDWSYDLLDDVEQMVFGRLAVFPARFDLSAAEAVAAGGALSPGDIADVVARLVGRSMVVRPGRSGLGRYRMLETIRQYAATRLDPAELDGARRRHAAWALRVAEEGEHGVLGPDEAHWNARLTELLPDLRAAFAFTCAAGDGETATRLTAAVRHWAYWRLRADVLDWGARLIAEGLDRGPRQVEAHAAAAAARWVQGRLRDARALAEAGVALAGGRHSPQAASSLSVLGDAASCSGDLDEAVAAYGAAGAAWTAAGVEACAVMDRLNEIMAASVAGRSASEPIDVPVRRARGIGNPSLMSFALYVHAEVLGDSAPDRAQQLLAEALAYAEAVDSRLAAGVSRTAAVSLRGRHGVPDRDSFELFHRTIRHWSASGGPSLLLTALRNLVPLLVRAGLEEPGIELAAAVEGCADTKPTFGREAERLVDALARARDRIGPERHAGAWERGCARTLDDATAVVLEVLAGRSAELDPVSGS